MPIRPTSTIGWSEKVFAIGDGPVKNCRSIMSVLQAYCDQSEFPDAKTSLCQKVNECLLFDTFNQIRRLRDSETLWRIAGDAAPSNRRIVMFLFCLLSLIAAARPASAEVTRIEFTSKQPYGTFRAGDYVIWQGKIHGDLSPQEAIPGIDKARAQ